jgi:tRNA(fMet)-specific endonuclease VapC
VILLDTDILSLLIAGNPRIASRVRAAEDEIGITVVTRIEILQARYDFILKASDGPQLLRAHHWLERSDSDLDAWITLPIDTSAAGVFDRLVRIKALRKIGRADLLIASIALAATATLITRNMRHFRQIPGLRLDNWAD